MAKRQSALLHATIEPETLKVIWEGGDGRRWENLKKHLQGQRVDITLDRHAAKRSGRQNRYYWGVVVEMIAEAMGEARAEDAHDALRIQFLRVPADDTHLLPGLRSTTDLTAVEFEDYMAKCRMLGSQMFGIYIPEPREVPDIG